MLPDISRDRQLGILRKMLMIRRAEEHCIRFNDEHTGLIRGHFHVYIGQEATGVSVCDWLNPDDYVFTTHRNHGHVIAKGGDPKKVLAEIIGRATGYCQGRAGTFHVAAPEVGVIHTSAIVGGCLALAGGTAYAAQVKGEKAITVVFFGDGAMEEGVFYEALNIAKLWQLPMIFWMENNYRRSGRGAGHAAIGTDQCSQSAGCRRPPSSTASMSARCTRRQMISSAACAPAKGRCSSKRARTCGPATLSTCRNWSAASPTSPGPGTSSGAPEKVRDWHKDHDPILNYVRELAGAGVSRAEFEKIDAEVRKEADEAATFALESPLPSAQDAVKYAFAGEGN